MTQGCVMTLTLGHISNVKVTVHTYRKAKVISPRLRSQCTHTENPCPGHNSSLPCWILIIYHTIISWPWLRLLLPRSKSQFAHGKNLFLDHCLSRVTWIGMILHTIVVHDQEVVVVGGICPVRTCLVYIEFIISTFMILVLICVMHDRHYWYYCTRYFTILVSPCNVFSSVANWLLLSFDV